MWRWVLIQSDSEAYSLVLILLRACGDDDIEDSAYLSHYASQNHYERSELNGDYGRSRPIEYFYFCTALPLLMRNRGRVSHMQALVRHKALITASSCSGNRHHLV